VNPRPHLHFMPRARRDIDQCLKFVGRQPWGKPKDRLHDINREIGKVLCDPARAPVRARRPSSGVDLRRCNAAQFVIVYAYIPPNRKFRFGAVSIRAIRHRRVANVFSGVREPDAPAYFGC
jgi:hypothetical protein